MQYNPNEPDPHDSETYMDAATVRVYDREEPRR